MTKEQEEAIEYFENKIKDVKPEYIETYVDGKLIRSETISLKMRFDKEDADKMQTVLSMLKEKDTELKKKDKIIDLMAEYISKIDIEEDICIKNKTNPDWCNEDYTNCKDCIKQYFKELAERKNE